MLIIICGLQGTGKTTVAKKIAKKIKAFLFIADVIRRELFKKRKYNIEEHQRVYDEMFIRAKKLLKEKKDVILDATFTNKKDRIRAQKIAQKAKVDFKIIEVVCPENIIKKRIEKRLGDESEARFEVYLKYKKFFNPVISKHIIIDTSGTLKDIDKQIKKYLILR